MADYKEMAQRWYSEVMSEGKTEVIDELCAPDFVDHDPLPVTPRATQLSGPLARLPQGLQEHAGLRRGGQQLVGFSAEGLVLGEAVALLRPLVPVGDASVDLPYEDRLVRLIQELVLTAQGVLAALEPTRY